MQRTDTPADPLTDLAFELERFEWTEDRLEIVGRWFGVRGHRFLRPTLHLKLGDRRRRLIALLDDKPWAADGEGTWTAAFAWTDEHDGVTAARLEVAPEVILDLPAPGDDAAGASLRPRPRPRRPARKPPAPRRAKPPAEPARPTKAEVATAPEPAAVATPPAVVAEPPASPPPAVAAAPATPPPPAVAAAPATSPPPVAVAAPPTSPPAPVVSEPPRPAAPAHAPSSVAAEIAALALERRLAEERSERERLGEELAGARREIAALSAHHSTAVERSREVVQLEGELAAANARADAAESRAEELERAPIEIAPLPPRVERRRGSQEWGVGTQAGAIAAVAAVLVVLALIIL